MVSKSLKRSDAATKGPLYSHFHEVITGLEVIRGYHIESKFIDEHHRLLDGQIAARLNWDAVNRWLGINLDLIGVLLVFGASLCLTFQQTTAGLAGLVISYAMKTTQHLSFAIRASTVCSPFFLLIIRLIASLGTRNHVHRRRPSI